MLKKILGGGNASSTITFNRFLVPNWTPANNAQVASEQIGWIVDMMMLFISRTLIRFHPKLSPQLLSYTHDFTISIRDNSVQPPQPRGVPTSINPSFRCFLITFAATEIVALIWQEKDVLEVFFPFPELHTNVEYKTAIDNVLTILLKQWLKISKPIIKTFQFNKNFIKSNIWIMYYACLRLTLTFDTIQKLFLNVQLKTELENNALTVYHNLGFNILQCVVPKQLINPNVPTSINFQNMLLLGEAFTTCQLNPFNFEWFDKIEPLDMIESSTVWPKDTDPKWLRFIPTIDAIEPVFFFIG